MNRTVRPLTGVVPVPSLGPDAGAYELGLLGYTLLGVTVVSTLVVGVAIIAMVLQVRWFAVARRVFVMSAAVLVLGLVASFVLDRSGRCVSASRWPWRTGSTGSGVVVTGPRRVSSWNR